MIIMLVSFHYSTLSLGRPISGYDIKQRTKTSLLLYFGVLTWLVLCFNDLRIVPDPWLWEAAPG